MTDVWVLAGVRAWVELVRAAPDHASVDDVLGARITNARHDYDPRATAVYVEVYRVNDAQGVRVVIAAECLVTVVPDPPVRRPISARPAGVYLPTQDPERAREPGDNRGRRAPGSRYHHSNIR